MKTVQEPKYMVRVPELETLLRDLLNPDVNVGRQRLKETLTALQVGKYGQLVNRQSGTPIPDDEPVFILRARDQWAGGTIDFYRGQCRDENQRAAVTLRMQQFDDYARKYPERMKEPDSQLGSDWPGYVGASWPKDSHDAA